MDQLLIMIPSYKRLDALKHTLKHLCLNTQRGKYDIEIVVGLNKATREERDAVIDIRKLNESRDFVINYIEFVENIGKAECLNVIVERYFREQRYILNLDNDMWIKGPWLDMLDHISDMNFDMIGFGGQRFWAHTPTIDNDYQTVGPYRMYARPNIAGGMSLYSRDFIKGNKFHGYGGVYGGVDAYSCTQAVNKYVLFWDADWLQHDPLCDATPEMIAYGEKKANLFNHKIYVFQKGWDE